MKKRVTGLCILTICFIPLACGQQYSAASVFASSSAIASLPSPSSAIASSSDLSLDPYIHLPVLSAALPGADTSVLSLPGMKNSSPWSELPSLLTPDTAPSDTHDNHETEQPAAEETDTSTEEAPSSIPHGTPLNESGSVSDLDYPFQKEFTDQMLLSFADQLLVIQQDHNALILYLYDPLTNKVLQTASLTGSIHLDKQNITVSGKELRLFDSVSQEFIYLNRRLAETGRIRLSEPCIRTPLITEDKKFIYYFASDGSGLKELSTAGGSLRTLKSGLSENNFCTTLMLLSSEKVLAVSGTSIEQNAYVTNFIDISADEILRSISGSIQLTSTGDSFGALYQDGLMEALYQIPQSRTEIRELLPDDPLGYGNLIFDLENRLALTSIQNFVQNSEEGTSGYNSCNLYYYNLDTGKNTYKTSFSLQSGEETFVGSPQDLVYLPSIHMAVFQFKHNYSHIVLWDLNQKTELTRDSANHSAKYYSSDQPDQRGIQALKDRAQVLGEKYGINIYLADECKREFPGYHAEPVYQTRLIKESLTVLEKALSSYPDDFFRQLNIPETGKLGIYIAGNFSTVRNDNPDHVGGVYFYEEGSQYLVLNASNFSSLESTIYHEISHAIDRYAKITAPLKDLYDYEDDVFNQLNPAGFSYDYSYRSNEDKKDLAFTAASQSDNVYFIDYYSKSFPSEDRARIMENAMHPQGIDYFQYPALRKKLEYMSRFLREIFDTGKWESETVWEAVNK